MSLHVKQGFDPRVLTQTSACCGLAQPYVKAGYNAEWDLVYDLPTGQALRLHDVYPSCLRAIQAYKRQHKHPTLP
jgi:hypothetical protein